MILINLAIMNSHGMTVLFASVYIGDYLVLTDTLDSSWRASFATLNCTNSTKQECQKCHPGSFANQSTCISYSLIVILDLPLKLFLYNLLLMRTVAYVHLCA